MKKGNYWAVLLAFFALMLAGCSSNNVAMETPQVQDSGALPEVSGPVSTGTPPPSEGLLPETPAVLSPGEGQGGEMTGSVLLSSLVNFSIAGPDGRLGDMSGLVLDAQSGQLRYLAVNTYGPQPARTVLIPWGAFQVVTLPGELENAATAPAVYVDEQVGDLQSIPQIDLDALVEQQDLHADWDAETRAYWSQQMPQLPVTGGEQGGAVIIIPEIGFQNLNYPAVGEQGDEIAKVKDLVLGTQGQVAFALLEPGQFFDLGSEWVPVPWQRLAWLPETQGFRLDATQQELENAPRVDPSEAPAMAPPEWDEDWQGYWENR